MWLLPYYPDLIEFFKTHNNLLCYDELLTLRYLTKYVSGEEEPSLVKEHSLVKVLAKSSTILYFEAEDGMERKRSGNNNNKTYTVQVISDTEMTDNLLGKLYCYTKVITHPINIGPAEFHVYTTTEMIAS